MLPAIARASPDPVERAMAAIGGRALLERVRSLRWTGSARSFADPNSSALDVETLVEPFLRVRSDSWPTRDGRSARQTLMIEGERGFRVIEGRQSALSGVALLNERQQCAVYGYMLMAGARWTTGRKGRLLGDHAGFPPIEVRCGPNGRMLSADYVLARADGNDPAPPIREHFAFAGAIADKGVTWPRKIAITRNGKPFFALSIETFLVDFH